MELIERNKLFVDMDSNCKDQILACGIRRTFQRGEAVLVPQQKLSFFGILLNGSIKIQQVFFDGSYSLLSVFEPGDLFGADLVCTRSKTSPYFAVAQEESQMLVFTSSLLQHGVLPETSRVQLMSNLMTIVADDSVRKDYRLAILSQKGLRARIMTYLTMQAKKRGRDSFSIPFSREDLASFLCVNRSALSHELSLLEQEGVISFHKNRFTLHKKRPDE